MRSEKILRLYIAVSIAMISLGHAKAQVVVPSQIVPPVIAPQPSRDNTQPFSEPATPTPQATADALPVIIGQVDLQGGFAELQNANDDFVARIAHKTMTVAELFTAANELEQTYARRGYVLARVIVPPQTITANGPIHILVIDGFIEDVDLSRVPLRLRGLVHQRLEPLIGRRHLSQAVLERHLLLSGELGGLRLRSALKRGRSSGGGCWLLRERVGGSRGRLAETICCPRHSGGGSGTPV